MKFLHNTITCTVRNKEKWSTAFKRAFNRHWMDPELHVFLFTLMLPTILKTGVALLLVDIQYDFLPSNGSLAVQNGLEVIPPVHRLLANHSLFDLVVATQVCSHQSLYPSFAVGCDRSDCFLSQDCEIFDENIV